MCLAVPAKVVEKIDDMMMRVSVGEGPACLEISSMLLPEPAEVGEYVIVHAGFALHKMDATEAQESLRLFRELAAAAGETPNF